MSYIGANAQGIIASIDGGTISNATLDSTNRGGIFLIDEQTVSAESTVTYTLPSVSNLFHFIIYTSFYSSATDNLFLAIRDSSNSAFACNASGGRHYSDGSAMGNLNASNITSMEINVVYNDSSKPSYSKINLHIGSASECPYYEVEAHQSSGTSYNFLDHRSAYSRTSGTVNNLQFLVTPATITGSFKVFGVKV